ncbi:DUF6192 family protein [Streptomyces smyrnaeus]|uniref:DUF6192 family protein n=1 Tax=Streptomyces smyrnaeus TaxID=1387713 RepID=UPI0036743EB0
MREVAGHRPGLPVGAGARWTAFHRSAERRTNEALPFIVHKILTGSSGEEERFPATAGPPPGKARWTPDEAIRPEQ